MSIFKLIFQECISVLQVDLNFFGAFTFSLWDVLIVLVGLLILWKAAFSFFNRS